MILFLNGNLEMYMNLNDNLTISRILNSNLEMSRLLNGNFGLPSLPLSGNLVMSRLLKGKLYSFGLCCQQTKARKNVMSLQYRRQRSWQESKATTIKRSLFPQCCSS